MLHLHSYYSTSTILKYLHHLNPKSSSKHHQSLEGQADLISIDYQVPFLFVKFSHLFMIENPLSLSLSSTLTNTLNVTSFAVPRIFDTYILAFCPRYNATAW